MNHFGIGARAELERLETAPSFAGGGGGSISIKRGPRRAVSRRVLPLHGDIRSTGIERPTSRRPIRPLNGAAAKFMCPDAELLKLIWTEGGRSVSDDSQWHAH